MIIIDKYSREKKESAETLKHNKLDIEYKKLANFFEQEYQRGALEENFIKGLTELAKQTREIFVS